MKLLYVCFLIIIFLKLTNSIKKVKKINPIEKINEVKPDISHNSLQKLDVTETVLENKQLTRQLYTKSLSLEKSIDNEGILLEVPVLLVLTADGNLHGISSDFKWLWTTSTGSSLASGSINYYDGMMNKGDFSSNFRSDQPNNPNRKKNVDEESEDTVNEDLINDINTTNTKNQYAVSNARTPTTMIPSLDGSLLIYSRDGSMKKSPLKTQDLIDHTPFVSKEGVLLAGQKNSKWFSVGLKDGKIFHPESNNLNVGVNNKESIWFSRSDFFLVGTDRLSGLNQFNVSYANIKPLLQYVYEDEIIPEDSDINLDSNIEIELNKHSNFINGNNKNNAISTPKGDFFLYDSTINKLKGSVDIDSKKVFGLSLGSPASQVFLLKYKNNIIQKVTNLDIDYKVEVIDEKIQDGNNKKPELPLLDKKSDKKSLVPQKIVVVQSNDLLISNPSSLYALELLVDSNSLSVEKRDSLLQLPSPLDESIDSIETDDQELSDDFFLQDHKIQKSPNIIHSYESIIPRKIKEQSTLVNHDYRNLFTNFKSDNSLNNLLINNAKKSKPKKENKKKQKIQSILGIHRLKKGEIDEDLWINEMSLDSSLFKDLIELEKRKRIKQYKLEDSQGSFNSTPTPIQPELSTKHSYLNPVILIFSIILIYLVIYLIFFKNQNKNKSSKKNEEDFAISQVIVEESVIKNKKYQKIGSLLVSSSTVLGKGSNGTVVCLGQLNGRPLAVKRILTDYFELADREISMLIQSDGHPNVVRYYLKEEANGFVYLGLQLCVMSIKDFIYILQLNKNHKIKMNKFRDMLRSVKNKFNILSNNEPLYLENDASTNSKRGEDNVYDEDENIIYLNDSVRDSLLQISNGLNYLHSRMIIHRDIKPHNILCAFNDTLNSDESESYLNLIESFAKKETSPLAYFHVNSLNYLSKFTLKISDMGLSKQIDRHDTSSNFTRSIFRYKNLLNKNENSNITDYDQFSNLLSNHLPRNNDYVAGTFGWQAPELLIDSSQLDELIYNQKSLPSYLDHYSRLISFENKNLNKLSIDIFSLGCVFYYILSQGQHPFGEWYERDNNISKGMEPNLTAISKVPEAFDLISWMLQRNPFLRPTSIQLVHHPFFWTSFKRLSFLVEFSDRIENENSLSPIIIALESKAPLVFSNTRWDTKIDEIIFKDIMKYRKYDPLSLRDLLRIIRNKRNHYNDLSEEVKKLVGPMPASFLQYFELRFPSLMLQCFSIANKFLSNEQAFSSWLYSNESLNTTEPEELESPTKTNIPFNSDSEVKISDENTISPTPVVDNLDLSQITVWNNTSMATNLGVRGWMRDSSFWIASINNGGSKTLPNSVKRNATDLKYRSKLCSHWTQSNGKVCLMKKKNKCCFAHHPIELRVKESRRDIWPVNYHELNYLNTLASGGEDVYGVAKASIDYNSNTNNLPNYSNNFPSYSFNPNVQPFNPNIQPFNPMSQTFIPSQPFNPSSQPFIPTPQSIPPISPPFLHTEGINYNNIDQEANAKSVKPPPLSIPINFNSS